MLEEILSHAELFFAQPRTYNDPFDSRIRLNTAASSSERYKFIRRVINRFKDRFPVQAQSATNNIPSMTSDTFGKMVDIATQKLPFVVRSLSLSARCDDILMWSHYADGHKGICLEFDSSIGFFSQAIDVSYSVEYPSLNVTDEKFDPTDILLTKSDHWRYEEEWRVLFPEGSSKRVFPPEALTGIIFGCETPIADKEKVRHWVQRGPCKGVRFMHARPKLNEFGLDILDVVG